MFKNILCVEMKNSKLINYLFIYLTDMCQSCQDAMQHVQYAQFGDHYYTIV